MTQLSSQDASFMYMENDTLKSHFSMLGIYDQSTLKTPLRYRDLLRYFDERSRSLPVLRSKLLRVPFALDTPYYVNDPAFHIEGHVRHIALPKPGDWRQFCILIAQLQAAPIDMGRPLWDMTIIEGLDHIDDIAAGSFAIMTRLHHSIADGSTARGILMALHHPAGQPPLPLPAVNAEVAPTSLAMLRRAVGNNVQQIGELQRGGLRLLPALGRRMIKRAGAFLPHGAPQWLGSVTGDTVPTVTSPPAPPVPKTIFNSELGYRRVFQARRYPLEQIKRLRALAPGATLNDVVLTLIGGAMRKYLARQGEKNRIDLVALCPINLREDKLGIDSQQGNNVALMQVSLATSTLMPDARLARVRAATVAAKLRQQASSAKELLALSRNAPNLLLLAGTKLAARAALADGGLVRVSNCIITNVPGPQEPLYLLGARLEMSTGVTGGVPGAGVVFPVTSYCGQLCISVNGSHNWIADPQAFAECLDASYTEMLTALPKARPTIARAPKRQTQSVLSRSKQPRQISYA